MPKRKTWREKLADDKDLPRVFQIEPKHQARFGKGTMVIPRPRDVDAIMRKVRTGRLITIREIRERLAQQHHATTACPITSGIFAWIAAHAAEEGREDGERAITPWWRTLKTGGELNPKYPGGIERQAAALAAEGHTLQQRGKRWFVADFEKSLARPR